MNQLEGKIAFVTGAANGIGLSITRCLLDQGMKVMMADVQSDALDKACASLGVDASRVQTITVDVRDSVVMAAAARTTAQVFGKLHVLCNNAGVGGVTPMLQASLEEWRWVLDVNLFGAINGVQAFLPLLQTHGEGGHIVNTCSMASFLPPPPMVPAGGLYATSKFALRGYTESLRVALAGSGVGVTAVYPAMVATALDRTTVSNSPDKLGAKPLSEGQSSMLEQMGIDPMVVARLVVDAIKSDKPSVFSHADVKPLLAESFEQLLAAFPPNN